VGTSAIVLSLARVLPFSSNLPNLRKVAGAKSLTELKNAARVEDWKIKSSKIGIRFPQSLKIGIPNVLRYQ
jgi:hypothetical protein